MSVRSRYFASALASSVLPTPAGPSTRIGLPSRAARYETSAVDSPGRYPTDCRPSAISWTDAGSAGMGRGMIEREGARAPAGVLLRPEPDVRGEPDAVRHPDDRRIRDRRDRAHSPREGPRGAGHRDDLPRHVPASADHERAQEPAMTATLVSSFSKALALGEIHEDVV